MTGTCCAYNCTQTYKKDSGISLHVFPKDPVRRKQWTVNLKRLNFVPNDHSKICSKHFEDDCFDREKFGGRWLKPTAVPTKFDFPPHLQPKETKKRKPPKERVAPPAPPSLAEEQVIEDDKAPTTSDKVECAKRKRLCYLGDFKDGEAYTQSELEQKMKISEEIIQKQKNKIKLLQNRQRRLEKKVAGLLSALRELKQKNCASDNAKDTSSPVIIHFSLHNENGNVKAVISDTAELENA